MTQENDLTQSEIEALREIAWPSLRRKLVPTKIQDRLLELNYVERKLGNLVPTARGKAYLALPQRHVEELGTRADLVKAQY